MIDSSIDSKFNEACEAHSRGDYKKALSLYRELADKGDATSQCNLATMFDSGQGCVQDSDKAIYWYQKAAENGSGKAQFMLGRFYANGECGLPINPVKAHALFVLGTATLEMDNDPKARDARSARDHLTAKLTQEQILASAQIAEEVSLGIFTRLFEATPSQRQPSHAVAGPHLETNSKQIPGSSKAGIVSKLLTTVIVLAVVGGAIGIFYSPLIGLKPSTSSRAAFSQWSCVVGTSSHLLSIPAPFARKRSGQGNERLKFKKGIERVSGASETILGAVFLGQRVFQRDQWQCNG